MCEAASSLSVPLGARACRLTFAEVRMRIVVDEDEERLIALVRHMHASGRSMRDIVTELRIMGVVTRAGKPLRLIHVWTILRGKKR